MAAGGVFRVLEVGGHALEILLGEAEGGHDGIGHARARIVEVIHQPGVVADQAFVAQVGRDAAVAIAELVAGGAGAVGDELLAGLLAGGSWRDQLRADIFDVGLVAIKRGLGEVDAAPALEEDDQRLDVVVGQVELRHEMDVAGRRAGRRWIPRGSRF